MLTIVGSLLPSQEELLCEIVDAVRDAQPDNPQLRVTTGGRIGARVFLHGRQTSELGARRPHADIAGLSAEGYLRKLSSTTGNDYYAVTPDAHAQRDKIASRESSRRDPEKQRPSAVAPEFAMARSLIDCLRDLASKARAKLDALLDVSAIEQWERGSGIIAPGPARWEPLAQEHRPLLGEAREQLEHWLSVSRRVFVTLAPEHLPEFDDSAKRLNVAVVRSSRSRGPGASDIGGVREHIHEALDRQLALLDELPAAHRPEATLIVADTNALIADPDVEHWVVPEPATIVVPAQVVAELDKKKNDPAIGAKVTSLIKRFKEYGRRGDPRQGVKLAGELRFRELAFQPDLSELAMLDPSHADDRVLATAVQLAHCELTSVVVVVTRDRNLFNKARQLDLTAVQVEDV